MSAGAIVLVGVLLQIGCSRDEQVGEGTDTAWPPAVVQMEQSGPAAYALAYHGEPPEGTGLRIAIHESVGVPACEQYIDAASGQTQSFWILMLHTSNAAPGSYTVLPQVSLSGASGVAVGHLVEFADGVEVRDHVALAGTVSIETCATSLDEWNVGQGLRGDAHVEFAVNEIREVECSGAMAADGTSLTTECACEAVDGTTFTCSQTAEDESCCYDLSAERRALDFQITAEQCSQLCEYTAPELAEHCAALGW